MVTRRQREADVGFLDKLRNKMQMGRGRAKQQAGRTMGDPYLESEGQADRLAGGAKQVGEQVKDAGKNIRNAVDR
jgi:uncharacterized protein YjbJ (UPF0337 family)